MKNNRKEAPNTYVPDRDQTAGRNNDNQQIDDLDRKYENDKAREGTNSNRTSFGDGERY